jgi:hypothetical protein
MPTSLHHVALAIVALSVSLASADEPPVSESAPLTAETFTIRKAAEPEEITGIALAQATDSTLLIQRSNGSVVLVMPGELVQRVPSQTPFQLLDADGLAADLLQQAGLSFQITTTEHYVICSNSSPEYAKFCGRLLELVHAQFEKFFSDHPAWQEPVAMLPVIVFADSSQFQEFAQRQHPDVDFRDVPGYYSVRDNQIMLMDLSRDRRINSQSAIRRLLLQLPRQMATVVHEAVHQLAFNRGLQARMADNPLWLSEGLALYFETGSSRSTLLWSRPGVVSPVHQPAFVQLAASGSLPIPIRELVSSDALFMDSSRNPETYAESWALTTFLINKQRDGFDRLMQQIAKRKPLVGLTAAQRLAEFETAIGKTTDEIQAEMIPYIRRLRVAR